MTPEEFHDALYRERCRREDLEAKVRELEAERDAHHSNYKFMQRCAEENNAKLTASRQQVERLVETMKKIEAHEARRMYETCPDCDSESICTTSKRCRIKSFVQRIATEALAAVEKERGNGGSETTERR